MWQRAVVFPAPEDGWAWATAPLLGLPCLLRVLIVLHRAGVREVGLPLDHDELRPTLDSFDRRATLPVLTPWDAMAQPEALEPVLGVCGGVLFTPQLLHWLRDTLDARLAGTAVLRTADPLPVLISAPSAAFGAPEPSVQAFEQLASRIKAPSFSIPEQVFCRPVRELWQPGGDRGLLATVGKATDRWHVEWVRRWTFPAMRWLARAGVRPNPVTWAGFIVALLACAFIAPGKYWLGIVGALLLYGSWVLDCMDGTLARLTFTESPAGQQLDTTLGHLSNLAIFGAIIWAVYGGGPWWQMVAVTAFILGGISIAYGIAQAEKKRRPKSGSFHGGRLRGWLDKINHRDYAVLVLLLAVVKGFHIFLWLSLIGIQVYWLLRLWLLYAPPHSKAHS
jgi:phosphatidylglycerophosphate synthase